MPRRVQDVFWELKGKTAALAGPAYFAALVKGLCASLGVEYASFTLRAGPEAARVRTLAFARRGRLAENFAYDLPGTPCAAVVDGAEVAVREGLQSRFPGCAAIAELGAQAFAGVPVKSRSGRVLGHLCVLHTAPLPRARELLPLLRRLAPRVASEVERARAEERFGRIAEVVSEVFWMEDFATGELLYVSPAYESIWGRAVEGLYRQPRAWLDSVHPDDRAHVVRTALAARRRRQGYEVQYRIRRADGQERVIRDRTFTMRGARGKVTALAGVAEDVTERLRAREELATTRSLYALGRLASGLSHDFNNVLTVLAMSTERLAEDAPGSAAVAAARRALARGSELTRHLSVFGRRRGAEPADVNASVAQALALARGLFPAAVRFRLALGQGVPRVSLDRGRLDLLALNLFMNARDAMPGAGGTVRVETSRGARGAVLRVRHPGRAAAEGVAMRTLRALAQEAGGTVARGPGARLAVTLPAAPRRPSPSS